MSDEKERLIEQWLEGSLDGNKHDDLAAWLKEDAEHMQRFVVENVREQMLRDAARSELVEDEVHEITPIPVEPTRRSTAQTMAWIAGLAACVLVAVITCQWANSDPRRGDKPLSAVAFSSVEMVQDSDSDLTVGDRLGAKTIEITTGIVRLMFDDGVEVTLQGPAEYELIAPGETRLFAGMLTATVPEGAEGFRVDTPSAQVVDLGTAFGIDQRLDGTSTVSVFDGEVEIVTMDDSDKRLLTEGKTIQLAADGSVSETEFSSQQFEKLWPAASGIAGSTGAFEFAPQWPRMLRRIESDSKIFVLPEGYAQELEQPCPIDISASGSSESVISTGQRVRSLLLQFDSVDSGKRGRGNNPRNRRRIEGSITFDRPVLGLIIKTETLEATDELFSLDRAGGLFRRGLELGPPPIADLVTLSDDRRTLTLDLFVVDRLNDHVRVIVDAELNTPE